jgi:signal transduction histidine kinase
MRELVQVVGYVNVGAFVALGLVAAVQWRARRHEVAVWVALSFGALALVVLLGQLLPDHPGSFGGNLLLRILVAALVVFPYLLFRFTMAFVRPPRRLYAFVTCLSIVLVIWTFALPHFPERGEPRSAAFDAWLVAFVVHWSVLSTASAWHLWRAGRGQPTVARRRMQLLSAAAAGLTIAIVLSASSSNPDSGFAAAAGLLATASAVAFILGLAPPSALRMIWRRPEGVRVQKAIESLMRLATNQEEVAARVLEPMAAIVGARALAVLNEEGHVVGSYGSPDEDSEPTVVQLEGVSLRVWTTPYAPFFGSEELGLLRTLAALTGLALDRVRLFEQEHKGRLALERANQVKTNFVALAAHELRTPVTTIDGFVRTLHHLGDRLSEEEQARLRTALEQQTARMAQLVEQLLDLSRLDADAIKIVPQQLQVRERLEEIVVGAAGARRSSVEVHAPEGLEASIDPQAFDRIVSNLVTNAFRYGEPPVIVSAERRDRHLRVSVEDCGRGVSPEFVPDLFERFTRSEGSRSSAGGTGLGLAIARSYALAHDGELLYEPVTPHGARFELVLPVDARAPDRA